MAVKADLRQSEFSGLLARKRDFSYSLAREVRSQ
jgi:hypothetical protein